MEYISDSDVCVDCSISAYLRYVTEIASQYTWQVQVISFFPRNAMLRAGEGYRVSQRAGGRSCFFFLVFARGCLSLRVLGYAISLVLCRGRRSRPTVSSMTPWCSQVSGMPNRAPGLPRWLTYVLFFCRPLCPRSWCVHVPGVPTSWRAHVPGLPRFLASPLSRVRRFLACPDGYACIIPCCFMLRVGFDLAVLTTLVRFRSEYISVLIQLFAVRSCSSMYGLTRPTSHDLDHMDHTDHLDHLAL